VVEMARKKSRKRSKSKKRRRKSRSKKNRNIYLGKRVKDVKKPGLDTLAEVERISKAIINDYKRGRISKKTASGRFARLHNTIIPKDSKLKGKKRKAKKIVKKYWNML